MAPLKQLQRVRKYIQVQLAVPAKRDQQIGHRLVPDHPDLHFRRIPHGLRALDPRRRALLCPEQLDELTFQGLNGRFAARRERMRR